MIDHASIAVRRLAESARFYQRVLEPLGLRRLVDREATVGFGKTYPELWLNARPEHAATAPDTGAHLCLRARDRAAVEAFHARALAAGGSSAGAPGPRQGEMTRYFGAFIHDLDGNRIEVATFPRPGAEAPEPADSQAG